VQCDEKKIDGSSLYDISWKDLKISALFFRSKNDPQRFDQEKQLQPQQKERKKRKGGKASARQAKGLEKVRRAVETFAISTGSLLLHPLLHTLFLKKHIFLASQFIKSLAVLALLI
jgi:hypothetical protein